ncbi:MAG: glycerate kinase [Candidatus Cloacimonetes bacterium]|nr:glycerate kinase [Candidatus Cloacimonadota bacterium]
MKIIIAPDSFKGALPAGEVAAVIGTTFRMYLPAAEIIMLPLADGGEGTMQVLLARVKGSLHQTWVHDPLMRSIAASYAILSDGTAVIETAAASGLTLLSPEERNGVITTTYGSGEIIRAALDQGCNEFIIALGGSATCDGGTGMAQALDYRFLDGQGKELNAGGYYLNRLHRIDSSHADPRILTSRFRVLADVTNPLIGPDGAARIYGPQKGIDPALLDYLDNNMTNLAGIISRDLHKEVASIPGSGAAGGMGAGTVAFLNARIEKGIDAILEITDFRTRATGADLIITGEGRLDRQSLSGKVVQGVANIAHSLGIPLVIIAGIVVDKEFLQKKLKFRAAWEISPRSTSETDMLKQTRYNLEITATRLARNIKRKKSQI